MTNNFNSNYRDKTLQSGTITVEMITFISSKFTLISLIKLFLNKYFKLDVEVLSTMVVSKCIIYGLLALYKKL